MRKGLLIAGIGILALGSLASCGKTVKYDEIDLEADSSMILESFDYRNVTVDATFKSSTPIGISDTTLDSTTKIYAEFNGDKMHAKMSMSSSNMTISQEAYAILSLEQEAVKISGMDWKLQAMKEIENFNTNEIKEVILPNLISDEAEITKNNLVVNIMSMGEYVSKAGNLPSGMQLHDAIRILGEKMLIYAGFKNQKLAYMAIYYGNGDTPGEIKKTSKNSIIYKISNAGTTTVNIPDDVMELFMAS